MAGSELQPAVAGTPTYATDLNQIVQALAGQIDVGQMALFQPIANPGAPTLAAGAAGNPNGAYKAIVVNVTGFKKDNGSFVVTGFAPSAEGVITVTNTAITWTLTPGPAGVIARIGYRTVAAGASGTEQFAWWLPDNTTTSYTDNAPDASLGTGMPTASSTPPVLGNAVPAAVPTVNNTGTSIQGVGGGGPNSVGYWLD